jgi:hypothetical protein
VTVFLSLCLGRINQFDLYKIKCYEITHLDTERIILSNGELLYTDGITKTVYFEGTADPHLVIQYYNIDGWKSRWLFKLHPDRVEYIVYLPKHKAEG